MRDGRRGSVTTAWPSAASVGASTIASTSASASESAGRSPSATSVPAAIVSGRPIPSSRAGTSNSRRSARRSIREASVKRTSASADLDDAP